MYRQTIPVVLLLAAFLILFPKNSHAYLDPGSGSYIIQMIIGTVLGGLFALKMYWKRLKAYLSGRSSESGRNEEPEG